MPAASFANKIVNFRDPENDAVILTQTFVEGKASLSVSLQCRLHGCKFMITSSRCPDRMSLRKWAFSGIHLGKGASHKDEHVKSMNQLLGRA